jgi:hypothetical protein
MSFLAFSTCVIYCKNWVVMSCKSYFILKASCSTKYFKNIALKFATTKQGFGLFLSVIFLFCFKSHYFLLSSWPRIFKKNLVLLFDELGESS